MDSVCIMIPTYNQSGCINKAVDSALLQDYPNLKIIIADDHSSDDTERVLQPYLWHSKIQYIKNKKNCGRVANYRRLLYELTDADWVINLDGDDYYTNNSFISEAMKAIHNAGSNKVLFYQGAHLIRFNGIEKMMPSDVNTDELILSGEAYFLNYFHNKHFSHMSTLYNRKLAVACGFYQKDILSADIFSVLQLCVGNKNLLAILSRQISGIWVMHKNNRSKTMNIAAHAKNLNCIIKLCIQAMNAGFNKSGCRKWKKIAIRSYSISYLNSVIKKVGNIFSFN